ncbi:vacuolar protein sorting-associated protein 13-like isoform X2 [Homarus americanus]|uniref:vacuolar protein sorting-associated protein 13-like isoform X2 n=1 Tax=Homarus americanus TaxID=6706 RepID=UPI001C474993|nr:vacuolar protein sorting-associated protein 13-like isoform X2 [Homarus americanus]
MFEGIVSEVLNRALGQYIENLDASKLKFSIWRGDVALKDLEVKQSALDELNLPVRPVFGHIGCLTLKIPWSNLYQAQWVAVVERVMVVVVPNTSIKYDPKGEEKLLHETKMAALQRAEDAKIKLQEIEKGTKTKSQDSFQEKLIAQVIRNIQVTIQDIHIRYEDSVSCPNSPFAVGVTLHDLSMKSTDSSWKPCLDTDKLIYKLNSLDGLGIYWNPNAELLSEMNQPKEKMIQCLTDLIAYQDHLPQTMKYIIGPICSTSKLQIDSKPEDDDPSFSIPVFNLDFVMDELAIGLSRHQYSNIMALLDSFDRLKISSKYRKYRPAISGIKGHAREWWLYAYNCKLENIRRVHHNWSWKHIKEHRGMCHRYKAAYKAKLENKRLTTAQVQDIKESEYSLDVFNLTLVRRQAEMEVEREGELQRQEKQKRGWFSGWFFGSAEKESEDTAKDEDNLVKKLKAEINDEEKQKLFEAIGYSESGPPPDFPPEFVNLRLHFLLKQLVLTVTDEDAHEAIVTRVKLEQVASVVQNRSGADALRVEASVREFVVEGYCVDGSPPRLVTSQNIAVDSPLLDVTFETNPLDGLCDQRVQVSSEPVHVVYDAATINQLADVFAPPKNVSLQQLQAAALSQLEVVKERSVTGLQSAIDNHSVLDLNIAFAASHIIIPERGSYSRGCSALVVTLGSMKMKSVPRPKAVPAVADLVSLGHSQEEVMETVRSYSYDHFTIELIDIQAIVSLCDEDWKSTLCCHEATPLHLLQPTTLRVDFYKCLLTNDPNLPKVKINVTLNDVALSVVDQRLLQLAYIAHSIPLVQKKEEEEPVSTFDQDIDVNMNVITEDVALARLERAELNPCGEQQETPQFTQLALAFTVNEISIELKKASGTQSQPLMKVAALSASVELTQRTFDLNMSVILGGVLVDHLEGGERRLLSTPLAEGSSEALLVMKFTQVDPKSPDFQSKHNSTSQLLRVDVSNMKAQLEQSAILSILAFVEQLDYKLSQLTPTPAEPAREATTTPQQPPENLPAEPSDKIKTKALVRQKKHTSDVITLKIVAKLGQVSVIIGLRSREVAQVDVAGLIVNVLMRGKDITITSQLKDFTVIDPARAALHPKIAQEEAFSWKIVEVVGTEAWDAKVSLYGEATDGAQYLNMQCVDTSITLTFGCARIVFLNKFIADVLGWVDKFQSAKEALASASVAAAAAAQATLQEAYKECSRISLSLTLRAPLILVPQDSKSLSGLMIDLGQISINNKFELGQERNELGYPAIYDMIDLKLHNVKLSRVELSVTGSLEREYELLQPISLTILICRNLTISWHKQRPEIDIQAKVAPIKVCLSEEDLLVTLTVLQDNLGEESIAISTEDVPTAEITEATESEKDIERVLAQHGHIFTKIKFSFTMEVVTLALLTGGSDAQNAPSMPSDTSNVSGLLQVSDTASGELPHSSHTNVNAASSFPRVTLGETSKSQFSPSHVFSLSSAEGSEVHRVSSGSKIMNPREALAEVSLQLVRIKGDMMSDGSLAANLVLFDCILQDTRPGQEGFITRMMERRKRSGERGMIDLTYHQEPTKDIFVDLRISGFVLVLHLPYLLRIQRFFMDNMPQRPEAPSPQPAKPKDIAKTKTDTKNDDGQPSSIMTLRVKVEQPDIALVDNVSTTDTSCIILHAEVNSDIKQTPMHQHINASITNIQMYTCCYNPEKRHKTLSQILNPCELSLMCSVTPSHAEHVDLKLSQVDLRVSPGTIELLSSILTVLSTLETPSEDMKEDVRDWTGIWKPKPLNHVEFSFLAVEEAFEAFAVDVTEAVSPVSGSLGGEMALVAMECLLVTLEAGSLTSPIPLIKLQASISATATGFRSQRVNLNGQLSTELAYYNPRLAVWEPLLEPVEMRGKYGAPEHTPWTLQFEVTKELSGGTSQASSTVSPVASPDADEVEEFEEYPLPDPLCTVSVTAKDSLELTVTRTSIEVFTSVSEAFSEAYNRSVTGAKAPRAPYRIVNRTGMHISVSVMQSGFRVASDGGEKVEQVTVESGAQVDLFEMKPLTPKHKRVMSLVAECQTIQDRNILLKIPSLECSCSIPVARADKRFFEVNHMKGGEKWGLVAGITVENGCKTITLSSCVQVTNHLDVTVDVYYMTERGNEVEFVLSLEQDECAMLPLLAVYTPTAELFFSVKGHSVCIVPFVWRVLQNNPGHVQELQCVPRDVHEVHAIPFLIAATGDVEQILWENTSRRTMKSALYKVHLRPPMVLHNLLPVPISLDPPGTIVSCVIMPGSSLHLTKARLGSMYLELKLLDYQSRDWVCGKSLEMNPPELSVWTFESRGDIMGGPLHLDLGMLVAKSGASFSLSLYCPFWMVNKTGLMLTYRKSRKIERTSSTSSTDSPSSPLKGDTPNNIVVHEEDSSEAILFSFKSKAFFGKKKATVKVMDGDWSEKFSLDVVGSSGSVTCKAPNRNYQLGVDIKLGSSGLTKIVIFSPFYKILNNAPIDLEVIEVGVPQAEWFTVLSGECIGWWPVGEGRKIRMRVRGTKDATSGFPYDGPLSTLLSLPNKYGGILGEVSITEGGIVIKLDQIFQGAATALIINQLTNTTISFWQDEHESNKMSLSPQSTQLYTWNEPGGSLKMFWACGSGKAVSHMLDQDDQGKMENDSIHWVVFLSNNQRCLLFTDDISIASSALNAVELERCDQDINLSLSSIGLSLVDDIKKKEVMYLSLASSGVVWEYRKVKGKKHRPFTHAQTESIEKSHQVYQNQIKAIADASFIQSSFELGKALEVDFSTMTCSKPFKRKIRRTFQPGVWFQFKTSPHQKQIHLKVNSVQIDNQMVDVMFPVVLARVPPPRSVMADTVAKPFCEVSIYQRLTSPLFAQYKYLAVLIQEFHVKVELPFVFAIMEIVSPVNEMSPDLYSVEKYENDVGIIHETLTTTVKSQSAGGQRDFFDHLHLSPIKMHLSFSLSGTESGAGVPVGGQVIHLFLQSVGVTLTEVQDVVFRLAYMERLNQWMNWNQLVQEMIVHYRGQVIKQLYVLVLGLDVIGNPFGLVVGLTKGVEDLFYEPIQGAIEGPGEFAEGMLLGVASFMGKTVGGAAGAVSRITGTIGKGVAALTLDDEYQKRRREAMHRKPADGIESLARGGKGIVTGVVDGVTGVFMKPIDGAKEEGFEGFFKGVGKGMVGLVTRPASGVIDFASGSFDAVMRAADATEEIERRRPARFIDADGVVGPYVNSFALGAKMLLELEKGRYAKTDLYVAHAHLTASKSILIATNKRIMQVTRNDILGSLKVDWVHCYEELSETPVLTPKGLRLSVKQEKKRMLGVFGGGDNSKIVHINSNEQAEWFLSAMTKAYLKMGQ